MKSSKALAIATTVLAPMWATSISASDHFDGPAVLDDPGIDISDMYVFPSPEHPDRLVLVMDVYPDAGSSRWFSNALEYRFRLRPATIAGTGDSAGFDLGSDETVLSCVFSDTEDTAGGKTQAGQCSAPTGKVDVVTNEVPGDSDFSKAEMRVFAGLRLDPFFMDVPGLIRSMEEGELDFTGENTAMEKNVLSIVLELDKETQLANPKGMYGVIADIRTRGQKPIVLDTFGRPEVTNVILSNPSFDQQNQTIDVRDLFNRYDPFAPSDAYADPFRSRLNANLHRLDSLDGEVDWPMDDGTHPLTALQLADFTIIDLSKPFAQGSWFEIERAIVEGREHQTSGGRWLNDDICDIQYSFLIARDRKRVSDGVDQATEPASATFPYLLDPLVSG